MKITIHMRTTISGLVFMLVAVLLLTSCKKNDSYNYVYPKTYLPAYPGSYWDYSNGERSSVDPEYQLYSYETSVSSNVKSGTVYVPRLDGQYLYEYSITQNSTVYPVKKLLEETVSSDPWVVNVLNNEKIDRETTQILDSLVIHYPGKDSVFRNVVVVVEYIDSLTAQRWNVKEYYAKNVGLIRRDINNPWDNQDSVVEKEIRGYFINN